MAMTFTSQLQGSRPQEVRGIGAVGAKNFLPGFGSSASSNVLALDCFIGENDERDVKDLKRGLFSSLKHLGSGLLSVGWNLMMFALTFSVGLFIPSQAIANFMESKFYFTHGNPSVKSIRSESLRKQLNQSEVFFKNKDGNKLHGWFLKGKPNKPTVVISPGMMATIQRSEDLIQTLSERGYGVLFYEFRGYGKSEGKPSEEGLYRDLEAASDYLADTHGVPVSEQVAMGQSLGGAVTVEVATRRNFKAVYVVSSFTNFADTLTACKKKHFNLPKWFLPMEKHLTHRYRSEDKIAKIQSPILIAHGVRDPIIPFEMGQSLYERVKDRPDSQFIEIKDGRHLDINTVGSTLIVDALDSLA